MGQVCALQQSSYLILVFCQPQADTKPAIRALDGAFHLGEHVGANVLRLGLIPLLGFQIWHIVLYEMLVVAITQFHHANISLSRWDRWLRLLIVTPDMHKVHHSRLRTETNSNFSTLFSFWDRLAKTFRMRPNPNTLDFGLDEFDQPRWQTFWGMLKTPFVSPQPGRSADGETPRNKKAEPLARRSAR
jgi:sterol desaturase/sphingolipid hydroxylase (fatty acid hydroxylase superfamily)